MPTSAIPQMGVFFMELGIVEISRNLTIAVNYQGKVAAFNWFDALMWWMLAL